MKNTPRKNNYFPSPAGCVDPPSAQSDAKRRLDEGRFTRYLLLRRWPPPPRYVPLSLPDPT